MMLMVRREALSRYKHLLESDTAQTELAGTNQELVSMTCRNLKLWNNEERMAQAVKMFKELDKNKD